MYTDMVNKEKLDCKVKLKTSNIIQRMVAYNVQ